MNNEQNKMEVARKLFKTLVKDSYYNTLYHVLNDGYHEKDIVALSEKDAIKQFNKYVSYVEA